MFAPIGVLADGPFPEHYEPIESPIKNPLHPDQSNNPLVKKFNSPYDKFGTPEEYSIVCTTYRLTEQYHYWTKNNPMNVQLDPRNRSWKFRSSWRTKKEFSRADKIKVISARRNLHRQGVCHSSRLKPMMIDGKKVYPESDCRIHQGFRRYR